MRYFSRTGLIAVPAFVAALLLAAEHEAPPVQKAAKILPADVLKAPGIKVQDEVPTVAFMETYTIESDMGSYVVNGRELVPVRAQEIAALRELLDKISRTEAFANAMAAAAKKTGKAVAHAVTNPVDTVEGVPKGVGRFLGGVGKSAKNAGSDAAEKVSGEENADEGNKATPAHKGASKAKRQLAKKFQIDPYTDNPVLHKKLDDLATAMTAGGFAVSIVNPIPIVGSVATVNNLVWDTPPADLRAMNDKKLVALGVSEATRNALLDNKFFTPTQSTALVTALEGLKGVKGAEEAAALVARKTRSQDDARFFRRAAQVVACYQHKVGPVTALQARERLFVAEAGSGALVVPAAVDLLIWSPEVDAFSSTPAAKETSREVWLSGRASEKARAQLAERGWVVKEGVLGSGCP